MINEELIKIANNYLQSILKNEELIINKEYLLPLSLTRAQIEQIFKIIFNYYLDFNKGKYFPGNILNKNILLSELILKKQIVIIEKVLSMIKFNVNIELLLDYFIIEMRKASD